MFAFKETLRHSLKASDYIALLFTTMNSNFGENASWWLPRTWINELIWLL